MILDVVFLHSPFSLRKPLLFDNLRFWRKYSILGEFTEVPMGFFPMASLLEEEGFSVKIFNLALEQILDPSLSIEAFLKSLEARVYAIDLHWFTHAIGALEVAKLCKKYHPSSFTTLGGFTATYYDLEIIQSYPFVDVIARGESESILLDLVRTICSNGKIGESDGVTYRIGNSLRRRPASLPPNLDRFKFTRLELMENWDKQLKCCARGYEENRKPSFWLTIARGCLNECIYCGGARSCYQLLTGRERPIVRQASQIAEDIAGLAERGVKIVKLNHDPEMFGRHFWSSLLDSVKSTGADVSMYWESSRLPSKDFVKEATKTFVDLGVAISPESTSQDVRMLAGRSFTNEQMFRTIAFVEKSKVMTDIYFLVGLPGETANSANNIVKFTKKVCENKHTLVQPPIPYTIDPHCPMAMNPEKYAIKLLLDSFNDYRKACSEHKWEKWIGHETKDLSRREIAELTANVRRSVMTLPQKGVASKIAFDYESV